MPEIAFLDDLESKNFFHPQTMVGARFRQVNNFFFALRHKISGSDPALTKKTLI